MYLDGVFDMFGLLKKKFSKRPKKQEQVSPKDIANIKGEPYIEVVTIDGYKDEDGNLTGNGWFEMDWNDIFVARLIKAGYPGKTDADIVDNWFREICQNVVLETFEQEQADPDKRNNRK